MSNCTKKISILLEKKKKLLDEESQLMSERKKEIGTLAERFGLLNASDSFLAGLMLEAKIDFHTKSDQYKKWENDGARFLKSKQHNRKTIQEITS